MLGIIIGVAAVIALVTTVSAVTSYMIGRFSSMGAGMLEVSVPGTVLKPGLTENDLAELAAIDNIASISPSVSVVSEVASGGKVSDKVSVQGRNEQYFLHNEGLVTSGRPLLVHLCKDLLSRAESRRAEHPDHRRAVSDCRLMRIFG